MSWSRCSGRVTVLQVPQLRRGQAVLTSAKRHPSCALNPASSYSAPSTFRHHHSSQYGRGLGSRWSSLIRSSSLATNGPVHDAQRRASYGSSSSYCFSTSADISTVKGPTFMELFGGIGSFGLAARKRHLTCVYTNENNRYNVETYEVNHCRGVPGISGVDSRNFEQVVEDVIKQVVEPVTWSPLSSPLPRPTVLFAGFPCQPFSNMGAGKGLDCPRNGHYLYEILKLLIYLRNPIVVLENVRPFANKAFGAMEVVHKEFEELVYHVSHDFYKAVDFNLPQNRVRLFIVAVRKDLATAPFKFQNPPGRRPGLALTDVLDAPDALVDEGQYEIRNEVRVPKTVNGRKTEFELNAGGSEHLRRVGYINVQGRKRWLTKDKIYHHTGLAGTLTTKSWNWFQVPGPGGKELIRGLSLREGLKLQGLPEGFVLSGIDSEARRQIGNAVALPMAEWIVRCLQDQYPGILNSDACSTTEIWPHVQAPKMSPEQRRRIMQHLDRLESRRKDSREQRKAQRDRREKAGHATTAGKDPGIKTDKLSKTDEEISAALKTKLKI